ncbi:MAG: methyltransferase domain-containing protein [Acidobacteriia bacterium]|nr:methyltransferase domain-containing protein [Terriglobia bacterium]
MTLKHFMAEQLRKPSGWFGSVILRRLLNRMNMAIVESTLSRLRLEPYHQILEIGFGGGDAMALISRCLTTGVVSGVDFSPEMVREAERRFRREIANGRLRVQLGDIAALPFASATFDRVFTINTIYFWPDTVQGFGEIRRVLKSGGLAVIALRSRENMERISFTQHGFRLFSPPEVPLLMQQAGFTNVELTHERRGTRYDEVLVSGIA